MPEKQIARAKERMVLLRADMTDDQVFETLGLSDFAWGRGSGPHFLYMTGYCFFNGLSVVIVRDFSAEGRRNGLLEVRFEGAIWARDKQQ